MTGQSRCWDDRNNLKHQHLDLPTRHHLKKNIVQKQYSPFVTPPDGGVCPARKRDVPETTPAMRGGVCFWKRRSPPPANPTPPRRGVGSRGYRSLFPHLKPVS